MGKFSSNNNNIYQELAGALPGGVWAMPAYFNNTVYYGSVGSPIQAFTITNAKLSTSATAQTANSFRYPGATPSVSANGTSNGIVWAVENTNPAVLHAYNATNLNETLQQQPGQQRPRSVRRRQQVHHANDCERQRVRRYAERRGRFRAVAVVAILLNSSVVEFGSLADNNSLSRTWAATGVKRTLLALCPNANR